MAATRNEKSVTDGEGEVEMFECEKCSREFDPKRYQNVVCPECGEVGSTYCCNPDGYGEPCADCLLEGWEDDTEDDEDDESYCDGDPIV